jgi:hypothetical protein
MAFCSRAIGCAEKEGSHLRMRSGDARIQSTGNSNVKRRDALVGLHADHHDLGLLRLQLRPIYSAPGLGDIFGLHAPGFQPSSVIFICPTSKYRG